MLLILICRIENFLDENSLSTFSVSPSKKYGVFKHSRLKKFKSGPLKISNKISVWLSVRLYFST